MRKLLLALLFVPGMAFAHNAPMGWQYPLSCCRGTEMGGDCSPIPSSTVHTGPAGFEITLHYGDHPLVKQGETIHFTVPYGQEKQSPDGIDHLCFNPNTRHLYCFFTGPRGV